jgi:HK97 gp10 family phage protein
MDIQVNVEGLAEIERKLKLLPERLGRNAMRRALRRGANVIRVAAKANAKRIDDPETREAIWKNIAVASGGAKRERQAGGVMMRVGVRGGARPTSNASGLPGGATWYWRMLEFGNSQMPAQPIMRPAMIENAQAAYDAIASAAIVEVNKEIAKL